MSYNIYFIEDTPSLLFNPHHHVEKNFTQFNIFSKRCIFFIHQLLKNHLKDKYLYFIDIICPKGICNLLISNILMYVDNNHLSFQFVNLNKDLIIVKYKKQFKLKDIYYIKTKYLFHHHYLNNAIRCG